jgi:hypothetical protein
MSFNRLLWRCLKHDKSHHENSIGVSYSGKPENGEVVLFFDTDSDGFRNAFEHPGKLSDALIFFKKRDECPLLLFVELKSSHADDGVKQLCATIRTIRKGMPTNKCGGNLKMKALLLLACGSPSNQAGLIDRMKKETGVILTVRAGRAGGSFDLKREGILK